LTLGAGVLVIVLVDVALIVDVGDFLIFF